MEQATLVRVSREHIAQGRPRSCRKCPVALAIIAALGDLLPEGSEISVGGFRACVFLPDGQDWMAILPAAARDFIEDFDDDDLNGAPEPFGFTLTWQPADDRRWEE